MGEMPRPSGEASLADLAAALRRRWLFVLVPTLLAFLGALAFVFLVSPRYTGEAKLLLQPAESYFTRPGQDRTPEASQVFDEQAVASEVQVVMSRDLAREAIKKLGLVGNPDFDPAARGLGLTQRIRALLGLSPDPAGREPEDRVMERYYDALTVYPVGKSRIVSIEFKAKDPDLAARAANTIAELYLGSQEGAKKDVARSASTWLGANIDALRTRVAESEARVEDFRARNGLLSGSGNSSLSAQQLSELSAQLAQARTARGDAETRAKLVRELIRDGRGFEIPDVANNELIRRLIEQRINLRAQLALESRTLLPQHPRIKELNAQLNDLEGQIRGAGERTARTLENEAQLAAGRVTALEASIEAQKKVVVQGSESEVQLRALEREARTQREQLEGYLTRYREATARDVSNAIPADARVVSRAVAPSIPSFPKKGPIVALTTIAAFVVMVGIVLARELLSPRPNPAAFAPMEAGFAPAARPVHGPSALPRPSAAVPVRSETLIEPAAVTPPAVDPRYDFGRLVERLKRTKVEARGRRVLVTGVEGGGRESEVAMGLALTLSGGASTILLEVDPDESVDHGTTLGLTDLVAGEAGYAEVIVTEPGTALHRVPLGTLRNEAFTATDDALDVVLAALEQTYDWIVIVLRTTDGTALLPLFAPRVDSMVLASNLEPANRELVAAYEAAKEAGAVDLMVAREDSPDEPTSKAA